MLSRNWQKLPIDELVKFHHDYPGLPGDNREWKSGHADENNPVWGPLNKEYNHSHGDYSESSGDNNNDNRGNDDNNNDNRGNDDNNNNNNDNENGNDDGGGGDDNSGSDDGGGGDD